MAVHFREVRIGLGSIDQKVFLADHARRVPDVPLMLEYLPNEAGYDAARARCPRSRPGSASPSTDRVRPQRRVDARVTSTRRPMPAW